MSNTAGVKTCKKHELLTLREQLSSPTVFGTGGVRVPYLFCIPFCVFALFVSVLCLVCPMSLDYSFLFWPFGFFSNVYFQTLLMGKLSGCPDKLYKKSSKVC